MQQFPNSPSLFYTYIFLSSGNGSNSGKFCCTYLISHSPTSNSFFTTWMSSPRKALAHILTPDEGACSPRLHICKLWQVRLLRIPSPPVSALTVAGTQDWLLNYYSSLYKAARYMTTQHFSCRHQCHAWHARGVWLLLPMCLKKMRVCLVSSSPEFLTVPNVPGIWIKVQTSSREKAGWLSPKDSIRQQGPFLAGSTAL